MGAGDIGCLLSTIWFSDSNTWVFFVGLPHDAHFTFIKLIIKPTPVLLEDQRSQASCQRHSQTSFLFIKLVLPVLSNHSDEKERPKRNDVGMQKRSNFTIIVSTTLLIKHQILRTLRKAACIVIRPLFSNQLPYNKISPAWGTCKIVNFSWLLFATPMTGRNLLTPKTPFKNGVIGHFISWTAFL